MSFNIEKMDPVIFRSNDSDIWRPGFFKNIVNNYFVSMEGILYKEVAPLPGNENCILKISDAFGLWDFYRLNMEGVLNEENDVFSNSDCYR